MAKLTFLGLTFGGEGERIVKQRRQEFALQVGWNRSHSDVTNSISDTMNGSKPSTTIPSPFSKFKRRVIFSLTFSKPSKLSLAMCQNRRTQKSGNGRIVRSPSANATPSIYPIGGFSYSGPLTSHHNAVNPRGLPLMLIGRKTIDFTHQ